MKVIAQKTIKSSGEVINVTSIHKDKGTYEGDICDLVKYKKNGITYVIERPLLEN